MRRATRLYRFSLVGAVGVAVQLGALAGLVALKVSYLPATALAVEAAVLHNFFWHQHFTWRDRAGQGRLVRLMRFHLTNGLISLVGNLIMMRLLVGWGAWGWSQLMSSPYRAAFSQIFWPVTAGCSSIKVPRLEHDQRALSRIKTSVRCEKGT
jgi:putative flippase GtrA